jgi:hypothetical protein
MSRESDSPSQSFGPSAARSRSCEPWPFLPFRASVPLERTDGCDLLCPLLTPAPRWGSLTAPSVPPRRASARDGVDPTVTPVANSIFRPGLRLRENPGLTETRPRGPTCLPLFTRSPVSLHPRPDFTIPDETRRVARAAFPKGTSASALPTSSDRSTATTSSPRCSPPAVSRPPPPHGSPWPPSSSTSRASPGMATIRDKMGHCIHDFLIITPPAGSPSP